MTSAHEQPNQSSSPSSAVDEEVLDRLVDEVADGDRSILDDLIESYVGESDLQVARLQEAADGRDGDAVATIAHSLRSASAALGALPLAELLQQTEDIAKSGRVDELVPLVTRIHDEHTRVVAAFRRLHPSLS